MASGDGTCKTFWYWLVSLLAWGSVVFIGVAHGVGLDQTIRTTSIVVLSICLLAYYISQFCSSSCRYLCNRSETGSIYGYMERMFYTPMHKVMHIQCYHFETRMVTERDSNGNTSYRSERVRVNTHFARERYYYISWRDISGRFDLDVSGGMAEQEKPFVKLHLRLAMLLAEDGTSTDFYNQQRSFIYRNYLDTHYDFSETLELSGYNEHTLVKVTDYDPPCFGAGWFFLFTLILCAEFYKLHLDKYSIVQNFDIVKTVSSRRDLNAPQYAEQYIALVPTIIYMGNVHTYNGPMVLAQGEIAQPPPPPSNMPPPNPSETASNIQFSAPTGLPPGVTMDMSPVNSGVAMNQGGQPGMNMNVHVGVNSPLLQQ